MGSITLDANTTGVSTSANTANIYTDVFAMTVQAGTNLRLKTMPLRMKLHTPGDAELPNNAEVLIGIRVPGQKQLSELTNMSYRAFANITIEKQNSIDTAARRMLKIDTKTGTLRVKEDRKIVIQVKSSTVVSWTYSFVEFDVDEIVL